MGYQTIICILNDALDEIENNKEEFIDKLINGIKSYHYDSSYFNPTISTGNHANVAKIITQHHASDIEVLISGFNTVEIIKIYSRNLDEKKINLLTEILERNNCKVTKKKDVK